MNAMIVIPLLMGLSSSRERVMLVDLIELNHVYAENLNIRFDQLLFLDWDRQQKDYCVEAFHLMQKCRKFDDAEHKRQWEQDVQKHLEHFPAIERAQERKKLKYPGVYVWNPMHPHKTPDGRWTVRIAVNGRSITIKARKFRETHTLYDLEQIQRVTVKKAEFRRGLEWNDE